MTARASSPPPQSPHGLRRPHPSLRSHGSHREAGSRFLRDQGAASVMVNEAESFLIIDFLTLAMIAWVVYLDASKPAGPLLKSMLSHGGSFFNLQGRS